jgi:hypothetical protein
MYVRNIVRNNVVQFKTSERMLNGKFTDEEVQQLFFFTLTLAVYWRFV